MDKTDWRTLSPGLELDKACAVWLGYTDFTPDRTHSFLWGRRPAKEDDRKDYIEPDGTIQEPIGNISTDADAALSWLQVDGYRISVEQSDIRGWCASYLPVQKGKLGIKNYAEEPPLALTRAFLYLMEFLDAHKPKNSDHPAKSESSD